MAHAWKELPKQEELKSTSLSMVLLAATDWIRAYQAEPWPSLLLALLEHFPREKEVNPGVKVPKKCISLYLGEAVAKFIAGVRGAQPSRVQDCCWWLLATPQQDKNQTKVLSKSIQAFLHKSEQR